MSTERNKIKEKIVKLLQKTVENGATEDEMILAMNKASDLMAHYDIEVTELQIKNTRSIRRDFLFLKYGRGPVADTCFVKIGILCDVLTWRSQSYFHKETGVYLGRKYSDIPEPIWDQVAWIECFCVYGFAEDTEIAEYMYKTVSTAVMRELEQFKKSADYKNYTGNRRRLAISFVYGMEGRINRRLDDMVAQKTQVREQETTGRSLVLLKTDQIKDEFMEEDFGFRIKYSTKKIPKLSALGVNAGIAAGDRLQLNKGLNNEGLSAITAV